MNLSTPLAWNDDVLLVPVGELPDELRSKIDCGPEDFALSRPQARTGSKILDSDSADLVNRFREPRTVVEAVILYGRARNLDPEEVLEGAFPLIKNLLQGGFLVAAGNGRRPAPERRGIEARWSPGERLLDATVSRALQVLEDTEVYLLERPGRPPSVLKIERSAAAPAAPGGLGTRLRREAGFLAHLDGAHAPRLLASGEVEGLAFLDIEWVAGVDAITAAAEWRRQGGREGCAHLLGLCRAIADAYAGLHARGVLHGDVHPSNVLVGGDGSVRLIDFGAASALPGVADLPAHRERAGIPFFYEPELASAYAAGRPAPAASAAGEQYALAVVLYLLATGAYPRDYSLGRDEMLREIAELEPLPFRERGAAEWPQLESVLRRALARAPEERYPSVADLALALSAVEPPAGAPRVIAPPPALDRMVDQLLAAADLDGAWLGAGLSPAPTASINYGAAGVGLGLLKMSLARGDARLLALADLWTRQAAREIDREEGFYNPEIDISRQVVGESSPYHTPSGVHAVAALVARAAGDPFSQGEALERFLAAVERPAEGLDLTLGRSSVLLGSAILLDALPGRDLDAAPLRALGNGVLAELWQQLDAKPAIPEADVEYLGIAHGWAGFLYATLQWCKVAGREVPGGAERRLAELAASAVPVGRGLQWAWTLSGEGRTATMPGWCNGACGYVFLWTLAHRLLGRPEYLDLAVGAAFEAFDAPAGGVSLCCALAGRGYSLLNLYRHTGETVWLARARDLAYRGATANRTHEEYPHSLWKGDLGLAVLAVDLERPEQAAMPFFEPLGYSSPCS